MKCACGHGAAQHGSRDPREDCLSPCRYPSCKCYTFEAPKGSDAQDLKPSTEANCMEGGSPVANSDSGPKPTETKP